jgi:hypothetical protein
MRPVRENKAILYEERYSRGSNPLFAINFSRSTDEKERWMEAGGR